MVIIRVALYTTCSHANYYREFYDVTFSLSRLHIIQRVCTYKLYTRRDAL